MEIKSLAGLALAFGVLAGCKPSKPELHIYTWSDYISDEVIATFEKQNDCRIVVDTFDSNEAMFAKLKAGSTGYDIITPSSYQIPMMVRGGMLRELDHSKLPNVRRNFDDSYSSCILDASFKYNVPYAMTYTGYVYRKDKVGKTPVDTWNVFKDASFKGRMSLLADMRETIGAALRTLGYSINSTKQEEIDKAAALVAEWKKNIAKFDNEQYKTAIASGEWFVGHGYSSDSIQIMLEDDNIGFALPKEGFVIAFDEMVIAADAPQPELAHRFIDFCYDPDVAAKNMTDVCAPMPVKPAIPKLEENLRKLMAVDAATLKRGEVIVDFSDRPEIHKMYVAAWDKIKAAK